MGKLYAFARAAMYEKGVKIYVAPTADARESWQYTMRHVALESRSFVLSCNQYVEKNMVPEDLPGYSELKKPARGNECRWKCNN